MSRPRSRWNRFRLDFVHSRGVESSLDSGEPTTTVAAKPASPAVTLVTHGDHGHPETSLRDELERNFDHVRLEYVDRCGCGGHVTRVHVGSE